MKTFPIMLDMRERLAVVVGGGPVGVRKVRSLRAAGAKVRLVALKIDEILEETELDGVEVIRRKYSSDLIAGAFMVFACTNDRQANAQIFADARQMKILVNVADEPEECDFYSPALVEDGDVVVAISTGGNSPALLTHLKKQIAELLPKRIGEFANLLGELKHQLKTIVPDIQRRGQMLNTLADDKVYKMFLSKGSTAVLAKMAEMMKDERDSE